MITLRDGAKMLRGALLMGLTWALVWGGIVGGTIELVANIIPSWQFAKLADIWILELGLPGFMAGALFSVLLSTAERTRRFDELSLGRFAGLGAAAGALLTTFFAISGIGDMEFAALVVRALLIGVPLTALSAATSSSVLLVARWSDGARLRLKQ